MKRNKRQLQILEALPLEIKIEKTKQRIREYVNRFGKDSVYISFSGGKDSTVLLNIVRSIYPDIPAVFSDTGLEFPEIKEFVNRFENIEVIRPKKDFKTVIEYYGYPIISKATAKKIKNLQNITPNNFITRRLHLLGVSGSGKKSPMGKLANKWKKKFFDIEVEKMDEIKYTNKCEFKVSHYCCNVMKKQPFKRYKKRTGRHPIIGTMASESQLRGKSWVRNGCNIFDSKNPQSRPMSFWKEQDVLRYIKINELPYCSVYGDIVNKEGIYVTTGYNRTGCVFCGFGVHLEKGKNRYQRLKETHPKLHKYCIDKLGFGKVLDFINIDYE